jgi:carbonic anhydrase/acetyltransferase-like protein (isoleucine patch superfamily)
VRRIVEQKEATPDEQRIDEVNVGLYCCHAPLLFRLLARVQPSAKTHEYYLTDIIELAAGDGVAIAAVDVDVAEVAQINSRGELAAVEQQVRARIAGDWMTAGVTLRIRTTYIDPDVRIGRDTTIGANVHLRGRTVIGERCRIDGTAFLTDATIADDVHLRFGVVATEAEIGARCEIGPSPICAPAPARRGRPHRDFVETKNARSAAARRPTTSPISAMPRSAATRTSVPAPSPATTTDSPSTAPSSGTASRSAATAPWSPRSPSPPTPTSRRRRRSGRTCPLALSSSTRASNSTVPVGRRVQARKTGQPPGGRQGGKTQGRQGELRSGQISENRQAESEAAPPGPPAGTNRAPGRR